MEEHVSLWPTYFPTAKRERTLAYATRLYNEREECTGYRVVDEHRRSYDADTLVSFCELQRANNLDIYLSRLYGPNGFIWLEQALSRGDFTGIIANSSNELVQLSWKGERNKRYKLINASNWSYGVAPNDSFLSALRTILNQYGHGIHASPASLGHAGLLSSMQEQGIGKIARPSHMLRAKLAQYSSGGRADDFDLHQQLEVAYESDVNNSYAYHASMGVPTARLGRCIEMGMVDDYRYKLGDVKHYATSYCQAKITIPSNSTGNKFSPFYVRSSTGLLEWVTEPGAYTGYWWYPMLERCEQVGYQVHIAKCWLWTELDTFMAEWVAGLVQLREYFKQEGLREEEEICKGIIVKSIGRFGMSCERLTLRTEVTRGEGDEKWLNMDVDGSTSMYTPYYLHRDVDLDANHLNQIASFIIMWNNLALYDRAIAEELAGNTVISTNYDAIFTLYPPMMPTGPNIGEWKVKQHRKFKQLGIRAYRSEGAWKQPGLAKEKRT